MIKASRVVKIVEEGEHVVLKILAPGRGVVRLDQLRAHVASHRDAETAKMSDPAPALRNTAKRRQNHGRQQGAPLDLDRPRGASLRNRDRPKDVFTQSPDLRDLKRKIRGSLRVVVAIANLCRNLVN